MENNSSYQPSESEKSSLLDRQPDTQAATSAQHTTVNREKKPRRWLIRFLVLILVIFLMVASAAAVYVWQHQKVSDLRVQNAQLQSQVETLQKQLDTVSISSNLGANDLTGITNEANTAAARSNVSTVAKKAEAHFATGSHYPTIKELEELPSSDMSSLKGTGINLVAASKELNKSNGKSTIAYQPCGPPSNYTDFRTYYYDFTMSAFVPGPSSADAAKVCN